MRVKEKSLREHFGDRDAVKTKIKIELEAAQLRLNALRKEQRDIDERIILALRKKGVRENEKFIFNEKGYSFVNHPATGSYIKEIDPWKTVID